MTCSFQTERLTVTHWGDVRAEPVARAGLEADLPGILTPATSAFLPPHMHLGAPEGAGAWIDARADESDVCLVKTYGGALIGLLILFTSEEGDQTTVRIGYLFDEAQWGKGYASELVTGLVAWCRGRGDPMALIGGVEADNAASIRVLQKAGFTLDRAQSSDQVHFYHLSL